MPALERLVGVRIVADPGALDDAHWYGDDLLILRTAPDEAIAFGSDPDVETWDSTLGITELETGFVGATVVLADIQRHIEWSLPTSRPVLIQGAIASVPAKLWLASDDGTAFLVTHAAYAYELEVRLGWRS